MIWTSLAVVGGIALLVWSADRFVDGAANVAHHFDVPPLVIGMVIAGFGTSAPEMVVSALAASQGNPGVAVGNAYGSNIANIALILGLTAILSPIYVHSQVLRKELPILTAITVLAGWQIWDGVITRFEGVVLLVLFAGLMGWAIIQGLRTESDTLAAELEETLQVERVPLRTAFVWLLIGLVFLIISSRVAVWGSVEIARSFGVSDIVIGLTVVAIGTSLPELASSISAARKKEHDIALGNVLGSNLFNTLAVIGIAAVVHPPEVGSEVFYRDMPVMGALTLSLFLFGYGFRGKGRINRFEGAALLACYIAYNAYLLHSAFIR